MPAPPRGLGGEPLRHPRTHLRRSAGRAPLGAPADAGLAARRRCLGERSCRGGAGPSPPGAARRARARGHRARPLDRGRRRALHPRTGRADRGPPQRGALSRRDACPPRDRSVRRSLGALRAGIAAPRDPRLRHGGAPAGAPRELGQSPRGRRAARRGARGQASRSHGRQSGCHRVDRSGRARSRRGRPARGAGVLARPIPAQGRARRAAAVLRGEPAPPRALGSRPWRRELGDGDAAPRRALGLCAPVDPHHRGGLGALSADPLRRSGGDGARAPREGADRDHRARAGAHRSGLGRGALGRCAPARPEHHRAATARGGRAARDRGA